MPNFVQDSVGHLRSMPGVFISYILKQRPDDKLDPKLLSPVGPSFVRYELARADEARLGIMKM
ncbi:GL17099 [Drosophila persimilis]|uniref:GL17099 n=1 Tax=Drosophila persimilis TaxID=7234 RepID=B4GGP7_DROPE|nr:GL17099 [Drosophila persimilis]